MMRVITGCNLLGALLTEGPGNLLRHATGVTRGWMGYPVAGVRARRRGRGEEALRSRLFVSRVARLSCDTHTDIHTHTHTH